MFDHDVRDRGKAEDDWRASRNQPPAAESDLDVWHDEDDDFVSEENGRPSVWEEVILRRLMRKT